MESSTQEHGSRPIDIGETEDICETASQLQGN